MSSSIRRKLRSEIICERALDDGSEGSSARTRPFSYDEIILKRKSKKQLKGNGEETHEAEAASHQANTRNLEHQRRDTNGASVKNSRDHVQETIPRRKAEKSSRAEHTDSRSDINSASIKSSLDHVQEASPRSKVEKSSRMDYTHNKSENKEKRDVESRSKHKNDNDVRNASETKNDRQDRTKRKAEEHYRGDARYHHENKHHRDSVAQDRYIERNRGAADREKKMQDRSGDDEKYKMRDSVKATDREKKMQDRSGDDEKYKMRDSVKATDREKKMQDRGGDVEKYKMRDSVKATDREKKMQDRSGDDEKYKTRDSVKATDREKKMQDRSGDDEKYKLRESVKATDREKKMQDRSGDDEKNKMRDSVKAIDREKKRQDRSGDDEKYKMRDSVKKHDNGSRRHSEISERKEKTELSHSRHDETRSKRRRSRSQERTKEKTRRSSTSSPKAQKDLEHGHDLDELSSHLERDKLRRHSDVDRSKVSNDISSSHHRRHGGSSSGLGGYSPRKRKSEAAVKTPSPIHSPERKSAGWDLPPSGADRNLSTTVPSGSQLVSHTKPSNMVELAAGFSAASSMGKPIPASLSHSLSAFKQASIDSVQLTQATRPMRRLYIDNIPSSATEKDIMEYFNTFLLSSGSSHIRGARPCISCMIHKEKGQALVEFLTPEDASAALSFDGRSLSGIILKIRRPKDFVEVPSGSSEKPKAGGDSISEVVISDFVEDSPHKIFIGGIAEGLSSKMIMEIASAFGSLKAYRFEVNEELNGSCAFLEYEDQSVTLKACAGLNGMKLGGRILTVAQAVSSTESMESSGSHPFYGIPEHVKPLLDMPTQVLKLRNVFDQKAMDSLSETDLEEIVEDVRLECSRFGSVVSAHVVKGGDTRTAIFEAKEVACDVKPIEPPEERNHHLDVNSMEVAVHHDGGDDTIVETPTISKEVDVVDGVEAELASATSDPGVAVGASGTSTREVSEEADKFLPSALDVSIIDDVGRVNNSEGNNQAASIQESGVSAQLNPNERPGIEKSGDDETLLAEDVSELDKNSDTPQEVVLLPTNTEAADKGVNDENSCDIGVLEYEVGSVLVEFRRTEASCMAAHCLHGRAYDDRIVTVEYVPLNAYQERFSK
ncbi:hypothetical protein BVRB_3g048590 isoform A [Beta vulgaris subsp. vulgaris]|uniref:uncharacterized protein LOC104887898 n=1 Tax=Beta vulgaris subsp. vulgaris TaxID=3555 RepID=UPI00053F95DC|nr:uncharacterized protein LOC104887898 [Beta vulgaris subsp. vulgaris]XP_019103960.1 uncharacterized protein LOC104887898 [Beta vulgaris subsp. vulgaris]XP_048496682.1 uncharacterized protein LOC104887898 [Beta vulgaris subsp. vulgaris]KMT16567.1 hypothetical protein BVRB_3g048590 isoform A [Beta vulgaris subsp. vulgaris]